MKCQRCGFRARENPLGQSLFLLPMGPRRPGPSVNPVERNHSTRTLCPTSRFRPVGLLDDANIGRFRDSCFKSERPAILPRGHFRDLPAFERWFARTSIPSGAQLNYEYLKQSEGAFVPLELTQVSPPWTAAESSGSCEDDESFQRFHAPLSLFLEWTRSAPAQSSRLYLAQCQLLDLPRALRDDLPTPVLVAQAGRGDIYDTNIWMGIPPTYTPLHRDPNPNLFVQLAGKKVVRLHAPDVGMRVFARVKQELGQSGGHQAAVFRGDEMMRGRERSLLEKAVWGGDDDDGVSAMDLVRDGEGYEAHLEAGDGLFIPRGWWHSIKGVGDGVTASVNWWFR